MAANLRGAAMNDSLVKGADRVRNHGEVFTPDWLVNDMLDSVPDVELMESRVLEPSSGTGNFLVRILERKLETARRVCRWHVASIEELSVWSAMSVYGVEILQDNLSTCRERMLETFSSFCSSKTAVKAALAVFRLNLVQGDTLAEVNAAGQPIIFPEWVLTNDRMFHRRDFRLCDLTLSDPQPIKVWSPATLAKIGTMRGTDV